jgi:hypothetical protein
VRFQVLTAASVMFRIVFWDVLPGLLEIGPKFCVSVYLKRNRNVFFVYLMRNNMAAARILYLALGLMAVSNEHWN